MVACASFAHHSKLFRPVTHALFVPSDTSSKRHDTVHPLTSFPSLVAKGHASLALLQNTPPGFLSEFSSGGHRVRPPCEWQSLRRPFVLFLSIPSSKAGPLPTT